AGVRPTRASCGLISATTEMRMISLPSGGCSRCGCWWSGCYWGGRMLRSGARATSHVVEADALVFLHAFGAALAAEPRLLEASEGSGRVRWNSLVDSDQAGLQPVGNVE